MFCVYFLYSIKLDRFYIGTTADVESRVEEHNSKAHGDSAFTARGFLGNSATSSKKKPADFLQRALN